MTPTNLLPCPPILPPLGTATTEGADSRTLLTSQPPGKYNPIFRAKSTAFGSYGLTFVGMTVLGFMAAYQDSARTSPKPPLSYPNPLILI